MQKKIKNDWRQNTTIEQENLVFSLDMLHAYAAKVYGIQIMITKNEDRDLSEILDHEEIPGTQVIVNPDLSDFTQIMQDLIPGTDYVIFHFM